jgi:FKBP-type peptidyl-prolyl cis-trans isomerase FkpA
MRRFSAVSCVTLLAVLASCSGSNSDSSKSATPTEETAKAAGLNTDDEKTIYAAGLVLSRQLGPMSLTPAEIEIVKKGLTDGVAGKPAVNIEEWGPKIEELMRNRDQAAAGKSKEAGKAYQDKAAAESGAVRSQTGMIYKELTAGTGASPKAMDNVTVNYRGTLIDGKEFDSSYKRNEPASFPLDRVIPCWTEGLQKMKVGGKAQLVCPPEIAYGDTSRPEIPGGSTLVFEVELLKIN